MSNNKTNKDVMRWVWGGIIVIAGLFAVMWLSSRYLVKPWVKHQLVRVVNNAGDQHYQFSYRSMSLDMWEGDLFINHPAIYPTDTVDNPSRAAASRLKFRNLNWFAAWWNKSIKIAKVVVQKPRIKIYQSQLDTLQGLFPSSSENIPLEWSVMEVSIRNGEAILLDNHGKIWGRVGSVDVSFSGLSAGEGERTVKISEWAAARAEGVYYFVNDRRYKIAIGTVRCEKSPTGCVADSVIMAPQLPRRTFGRRVGHEVDRLKIKVNQIAVHPARSGWKKGVFNLQKIEVNAPDISIYRDKTLPENPGVKPLPHQLLKRWEVPFRVDTIQVRNAQIRYTEQRGSDRIGKVVFKQLNARLTGITNLPKKIKKGHSIDLEVHAYLQGEVPLNLRAAFSLKQNGYHKISGSMGAYDLTKLNSVMVPLTMVRVDEGRMRSLDFHLQLDRKEAVGHLIMRYENLNLQILGKEDIGHSDHKQIISFLANTFKIRSSSRTPPEPAPVHYERNPQKSIFNYWWKAVASGLKKSIGL